MVYVSNRCIVQQKIEDFYAKLMGFINSLSYVLSFISQYFLVIEPIQKRFWNVVELKFLFQQMEIPVFMFDVL